ncbi:hypothetical protein EHYA_05385 [Embleya hyalina]|uniref:Uncharacterized protein n=1 Tax=Embleya hyalina TaxID=516124 RepID=A0A401YSY0_9ACTN|nr:hypothetical protein EHYA_05385 [Embleya hyalina]
MPRLDGCRAMRTRRRQATDHPFAGGRTRPAAGAPRSSNSLAERRRCPTRDAYATVTAIGSAAVSQGRVHGAVPRGKPVETRHCPATVGAPYHRATGRRGASRIARGPVFSSRSVVDCGQRRARTTGCRRFAGRFLCHDPGGEGTAVSTSAGHAKSAPLPRESPIDRRTAMTGAVLTAILLLLSLVGALPARASGLEACPSGNRAGLVLDFGAVDDPLAGPRPVPALTSTCVTPLRAAGGASVSGLDLLTRTGHTLRTNASGLVCPSTAIRPRAAPRRCRAGEGTPCTSRTGRRTGLRRSARSRRPGPVAWPGARRPASRSPRTAGPVPDRWSRHRWAPTRVTNDIAESSYDPLSDEQGVSYAPQAGSRRVGDNRIVRSPGEAGRNPALTRNRRRWSTTTASRNAWTRTSFMAPAVVDCTLRPGFHVRRCLVGGYRGCAVPRGTPLGPVGIALAARAETRHTKGIRT